MYWILNRIIFGRFQQKKELKTYCPGLYRTNSILYFLKKWKPNFPPIQVQGWGSDDNLHTFNASLIRSWRPSRYSRTFAFLSWILTFNEFWQENRLCAFFICIEIYIPSMISWAGFQDVYVKVMYLVESYILLYPWLSSMWFGICFFKILRIM